jgi:hypothetical protein
LNCRVVADYLFANGFGTMAKPPSPKISLSKVWTFDVVRRPMERDTSMTTTRERMSVERMIGLLTAVVVVGVVLYLVIRNQPIADDRLVELLRIILSVAMGVLGATIPGFLHIEYKLGGLAVRAAGALALVVLTYFYTPKVGPPGLRLKPADVSVATPTRIDLRASTGGSTDPEERSRGTLRATLDLAYHNRAQPGESATLQMTALEFVLAGKSYRLPWLYFSNIHQEQQQRWLAIESSAVTQTIGQGATVPKEIMHAASDLLWTDFIQQWRADSSVSLRFKVISTIDAKPVDTYCTVDSKRWLVKVEQYIKENAGQLPMRVTMCCTERPTESTVAGCMT